MKIQLSIRAGAELEQAVQYLYEQNPIAATSLADAIDLTFEHLMANPRVGRVLKTKSGLYHAHPIKGFPYRIFYRIEGDQILIASIFHTARNPNKI